MTSSPGDDPRSTRERMLAGEPYIADDPELAAMHQWAVGLTDDYNAAGRSREDRQRLLRELFASVGEDTAVRPPLYVDYGTHVSIGSRCFANYGLVALDVCTITIGDDVQIGPNVQLLTPTHPVAPGPRRDRPRGPAHTGHRPPRSRTRRGPAGSFRRATEPGRPEPPAHRRRGTP